MLPQSQNLEADEAPPSIALKAVIYGLLFWGCSELSWLVSYRSNTNVVYWLPVGLAIATYLSTSTRQWRFLVIAQFLGNFAFDYIHGAGVGTTLVYCAINVVEDLASCYAIRRIFGTEVRMNVMREFVGMNLVFIIVNFISVSIQASALVLMGSPEAFLDTILVGISSNAMNVITLTPAILIWLSPSEPSQRWWREPFRNLEAVLLLLSVVGIAWFLETRSGDILGRGSLVFVLPAIWAGLRFGVRGASVTSTLMSLIVVICAVHFQKTMPQQIEAFGGYAASLYGFMGICALVGLVPAVAVAERDLLVQELAQTPIFWVSSNGRIRRVNASTCKLLGYTPAQMLGETLESLGLALSAPTWKEHWDNVKRRKTLSYELTFKPSDSDPIRIQASVHGFVFEGSEYHFFSLHDITELRNLEDRLRQLQKMELIGQFSGGVAHDFNNQLTVMRGNLGMIKYSRTDLAPEVAESLDEIDRAVGRAAKLTEQLLTFSRKKVFNRTRLDLNEACVRFSKMIKRLVGETFEFEMVDSPDPLPILADQSMIEQVLLNLCLNARDSMPNGGRLVLSTMKVEIGEDDLSKYPGARVGTFARLTVEDSGEGISPTNLTHVFEPFFTTKGVGKGTGLGLASVLGIIQQHEGWITVESIVSKGSTFTVHLPLYLQGEPPPTRAAADSATPWTSRTILLVEDDFSVRLIANRVLERLGYAVLVANDGKDARQLWASNCTRIDLLLSDMVMPGGISGVDLALGFWTDKPDLKVILMTGYSADLDGIESLKARGATVLLKPFEIDKLRDAVRERLSGR